MLIVLIFLFIYVNNFVSAKHTGIYGNEEMKNCSRVLGALLSHMKDRQKHIKTLKEKAVSSSQAADVAESEKAGLQKRLLEVRDGASCSFVLRRP